MTWRLNLRQLEAFRALMLTGTTTQAARALHLSQPVVSRLIKDLEGQLNVSLFERKKGRLLPTPHATWLFEEAEETLGRLDKLDSIIRDVPRTPHRSLKVLSNSAMGFSVVPFAVHEFRKRYPEVTVSNEIVMRRDNRRWINDQNFDIAVTMLPIEYPEESVRPIARVPSVCIMPKGHDLERLEVVAPADLDGLPLVALHADNLTRARLNSLFEQTRMHLNIVVEAQTAISLCAHVAAGLGIGIVDPFTASRFEALGLSIRPFASKIDYVFGLVFPIHEPRTLLTQAIVPFIESQIDKAIRTIPNCTRDLAD